MFYNYQLHLTDPNLFEFVPYDYYQIINSDKKKEIKFIRPTQYVNLL